MLTHLEKKRRVVVTLILFCVLYKKDTKTTGHLNV